MGEVSPPGEFRVSERDKYETMCPEQFSHIKSCSKLMRRRLLLRWVVGWNVLLVDVFLACSGDEQIENKEALKFGCICDNKFENSIMFTNRS